MVEEQDYYPLNVKGGSNINKSGHRKTDWLEDSFWADVENHLEKYE